MEALIGIAIAIAVVVLVVWLVCQYFLLAFSAVQHFGASIGLLTSIVGLGLLVWFLTRGFMRVYARPGIRSLAWLPISAIISLVGVDLLWLLAGGLLYGTPPGLLGPFDQQTANSLHLALQPLVLHLPGNRQAVEAGALLFPGGATMASTVLLSIATKIIALVPLLVLARGMDSEPSAGPEPARVQYFFGQARADLAEALKDTARELATTWRKVGAGLGRATFGGLRGFLLWPFTLCAAVGSLVPIVVTLASMTLIMILASVAFGVVWSVNAFMAVLLGLCERAVLRVRSGHARCPHAGCHHAVSMPTFACPQCGAHHEHLVPGQHGVFSRTCNCGRDLPTAFWLGKGKLASFCPNCKRPMYAALFDGSIHLPIYGAPSAGKTMLLMASVWTLRESKVSRLAVDFIEDMERDRYDRQWKPAFERGAMRDKTTQLYPDAVLMSARRAGGLPVSLYLYDAAGDVLTSEAHLQEHRFLRFFDGLVFVIDPLTLPPVRQAMAERGQAGPPASRADEDIRGQLQRLHNALNRHRAVGPSGRTSQRLAVVLSKTDVEGVREVIGLPPPTGVLAEDWSQGGQNESALISAWLAREQPAFMQALNSWFSEVRFFAVSATGGAQESGAAFQPQTTVAPLLWLLSSRRALQRPRLSLVLGWSAEAAAVATVVLGMIGVPAFVALEWVVPQVSGLYDANRGNLVVPAYYPQPLISPPQGPPG